MIAKSLIAIFVILFVANAQLVSVGDNQVFQKPAFNSLFKISSINALQLITVSIQWGDSSFLQSAINVYLYPTTASPGAYGTPLACPTDSTTCSVTFDNTYTQNSGDYYVFLQYSGGQSVAASDYVLVSTLTVSGDSTLRTSPIILKETFALGPYRFHRIFSSTPKTLNVTLYATNSNQVSYYNTDGLVRVYTQTANVPGYLLNSEVSLANARVIDNTAFTLISQFSLNAGYYWIVIDLSAQSYPSDTVFTTTYTLWNYRISYSTEVYTCPYITDYPDYTGVFRGCAVLTDKSQLPCINYDNTLGQCLACYSGYTLSNGTCVQSACPAGQYKQYGQCIQNPTGCDTYSDFAKCTQCSAGYTLTSGVCNRTPLNCTGRTFFNSTTWTCDNVSAKCKAWGTNGLCTSCLSATQKPVNGICVPIDSTCTATQYVDANGNCVESDLLCSTFQKYGGKCTLCIWGYQLDTVNNKCNKIVCPDRYVPNDYGKCAKVSDLCADYDAKGNCLACIPSHTLTANGTCLQLESPAPCPPRQYLGDDNFCHDVSDFCDTYDRTTGMCSQCIGGYYLMYTGECVLQKTCASRQILIDNDCHDVSPTCGNYDRATGKCLNCVSSSYELYYGLCIPVTTCGPRQWTDNNGGCHDVDNKCNTFNPSTGACTSCVQGYNYLNGICCVTGQYNLDGNCVAATNASSLTNSNGCRTYTNGIGCLRCDTGFQRLQDQFGFYYCQAV